MLNYLTGRGVNDVYARGVAAVMDLGADIPSRNGDTKELHPAIIELEDPTLRVVTSAGRPINVAFAMAEVLWILLGRDDVKMLEFYNSNIGNYSDDGVRFNAAYGNRLRNNFGIDQIDHAIQTLQRDPGSRQVTLVISDPLLDRTWLNDTVQNVTLDRACNVMAHLMIRKGKLDWLQIVRSNDAIWGAPYNWIQFTCLQEWIANSIGVPVGNYVHVADSFHIYEPHWMEATSISYFDLYQSCRGHAPILGDKELLGVLGAVEQSIRTTDNFDQIPLNLPQFWIDCCRLWAAHRFYTEKEDKKALRLLLEGDEIMGYSMIRFYYHHRWSKGTNRDHWDNLILRLVPEPAAIWILLHAAS